MRLPGSTLVGDLNGLTIIPHPLGAQSIRRRAGRRVQVYYRAEFFRRRVNDLLRHNTLGRGCGIVLRRHDLPSWPASSPSLA